MSDKPFVIEKPGFYRQRDGGKAEVTSYDSDSEGWNGRYAAEPSAPIDLCWYKDGRASCVTAQDPNDLIAPWVEEEFEVVTAQVALYRSKDGYYALGGQNANKRDAEYIMLDNHEFRIPRPKVVKPKVTAEAIGKYVCLAVESSQDGDAFARTIDRSQAIALRDALVAAKLDGEGKGE